MDAQTRLPELNLHLNGCSIPPSLANTRTTLITFQHMLPAVLMGAGEWWGHCLTEGEGGPGEGSVVKQDGGASQAAVRRARALGSNR